MLGSLGLRGGRVSRRGDGYLPSDLAEDGQACEAGGAAGEVGEELGGVVFDRARYADAEM